MVESILSFVVDEAVNCSLSKCYFGNVWLSCCAQKGLQNFGGSHREIYREFIASYDIVRRWC